MTVDNEYLDVVGFHISSGVGFNASDVVKPSCNRVDTTERGGKMTEAETVHSLALTYFSMRSLPTFCPLFVILPWCTLVPVEGF